MDKIFLLLSNHFHENLISQLQQPCLARCFNSFQPSQARFSTLPLTLHQHSTRVPFQSSAPN